MLTEKRLTIKHMVEWNDKKASGWSEMIDKEANIEEEPWTRKGVVGGKHRIREPLVTEETMNNLKRLVGEEEGIRKRVDGEKDGKRKRVVGQKKGRGSDQLEKNDRKIDS